MLLALDNRGITLARLKAVVARLQRGAHATLVIQRGDDRFALRLVDSSGLAEDARDGFARGFASVSKCRHRARCRARVRAARGGA